MIFKDRAFTTGIYNYNTIYIFLLFFSMLSCTGSNKNKIDGKPYKFDKKIFGKLKLYDSLRIAVTSHLKEIFNSKVSKDEYSAQYSFCTANGTSIALQIPDSLMRPLVPLMYSIGKKYLTELTIERDGTFTVFFNEHNVENHSARYYESIYWTKRIIVEAGPEEDLPPGLVSDGMVKDTIIGSGYHYYIYYDTHIGH